MKDIATRQTMLIVLLCASYGLLDVATAQEFRRWTTSDGTRSGTRLLFIKRDGDTVMLKREDNQKVIAMPMKKLSVKDRRYVAEVRRSADTSLQTGSEGADDWPQWRGLNRDGKSNSTGLITRWPSGGPNLVWKVDSLGEGYSTPAIAGNVIYLLGTRGNDEFMMALSADDGASIWQTKIGTKTGGGGFPGPRGTPTVDGKYVFAIGGEGALVCLQRENGKRVWAKELQRDFAGSPGHWRYTESPLIDGKQLICTPGGDTAAVVALNKFNGDLIWKSVIARQQGDGAATAGYASPIAADIAGTRQYIVFLHGGVFGVDARNGQKLWLYESPANGTANCSTPVFQGNNVFAASGYGTGGGRVTISRQGRRWFASEDYFVKKMQSHHGGFVLHEDHLYGTNNSVLLCIDWETGDIKWQNRSVGKGSITLAEGHLYVRSEDGDVALVEATPEAYREKGRFSQPDRSGKNTWPYPVIANKRLYLHDQDRLLCYLLE